MMSDSTTSTSSSDDKPSGLLHRISKIFKFRKRRKHRSSSDSDDESSDSSDAEHTLTTRCKLTPNRGGGDAVTSESDNDLMFIPSVEENANYRSSWDSSYRHESYSSQYPYRLVCPHAGQFGCSLTGLVFVVEAEAELLYKTVSWDPRLLDGLGQNQPAGPLYNIDCLKGSISQLHLPHCEILSEDYMDGLAVAHFTDGNVEIIQAVNVSKTHVTINIQWVMGSYGLVWRKKILGRPISGQVLLFLRTINDQKEKILNVHLLPGNVSVSKVREVHQDKKYIETSSKCRLYLDREYRVCCQPEKCEVQPKSEIFDHNNFEDKNYHPTFEVFLDVSVEEVRLGILDKTEDEKEVWNRRRILLTAPSRDVEPAPHRSSTEYEFVLKQRDKLIDRVLSAMGIADGLKSRNMITNEIYRIVRAAKTPQEQMRDLFSVVDSGGAPVKAEFYRLLKEKEPYLVEELEAGAQSS